MRTAVGVIVGAVLAWCWLAIWKGPSHWFFYHIEPVTPADHVDRMIVYRHGVKQDGAPWPE